MTRARTRQCSLKPAAADWPRQQLNCERDGWEDFRGARSWDRCVDAASAVAVERATARSPCSSLPQAHTSGRQLTPVAMSCAGSPCRVWCRSVPSSLTSAGGLLPADSMTHPHTKQSDMQCNTHSSKPVLLWDSPRRSPTCRTTIALFDAPCFRRVWVRDRMGLRRCVMPLHQITADSINAVLYA